MGKRRDTEGQRMLAGTRPPPQRCRQVLCLCEGCGFRMRTTAVWIGRGLPTCQCGGEIRVAVKRRARNHA